MSQNLVILKTIIKKTNFSGNVSKTHSKSNIYKIH